MYLRSKVKSERNTSQMSLETIVLLNWKVEVSIPIN